MRCSKVHKHIKAYLDNELSGDDRQRMQQHLRTCSRCCREAKDVSALWDRLSALPQEKAPPDILPIVMERISDYEQRPFRGKLAVLLTAMRSSFATAAVAAMLIGFFSGFGLAKIQSHKFVTASMDDDPLGLEVFFDTPPSSISGAYTSLFHEEGEVL